MLIRLSCLGNLSILDVATNKFKNFLHTISDIIGYSGLKPLSSALIVSNIRIKAYSRMKSLIDEEWYHSCRGEYNIVVDELRNRESLELIILHIVAVYSKMSFEILIGSLRLTISFRVKSSW